MIDSDKKDTNERPEIEELEFASFADSFELEEIPEDLIRDKVRWEIEEAERRLKIEEEKAARELEQPLDSLKGLPDDIIKAKILNDISLADRRMKLEELKAENDILLKNKIEAFRQAEALRLSQIVTNQEHQHWLRKYWRAAAGWTYLFICLFDFVLAPVLFAILPMWTRTQYQPWTSLTLSNGGLMHISFGAILGVAAWTRGQTDMMKTQMVQKKVTEDSPL